VSGVTSTQGRLEFYTYEFFGMSRVSLQIAFLAASLLGGAAAAQVPRFASGSSLVVLSATAVDGHGRPVRDLRPQDFRIYEEGRLQKLAHFAVARESRARILLLVDASGSMNGELKTASAKMAALQILDALDKDDEVALAGFDHKYWGIVAFTTNRRAIADAFGELEPFGSTALHDALDHAARDLASHGEGRRAVIVITDGVDTASQKTADEVIASSRALDVPIYAVSVLSPLDDPASPRFTGQERPAAATAGSEVLARYASLSGGAAFSVSDFKGLKQAAAQIVDELKHQYRLGYDPPLGPPRFRRIEVRTTRKGIVVRTRSGYLPQS
jgi:Ca-activated chloride channel family protein